MLRGKPLHAPPRPKLPIALYSIAFLLACFLFYWTGFFCKDNRCGEGDDTQTKNKQYVQYFPMLVSPLLAVLSLTWLVTNLFYANTPCSITYNCMEMPTAVFSSLLSGISAVIEIHYSIDFEHLHWSQKWNWAAADAIILCGIHAVLAFALQ